MKGFKLFWVCFCALLFALGGQVRAQGDIPPKEGPVYSFDDSWTENNRLVAHACGGIEGKTYTNSREAFELSYQNGHRIFEIDFVLTLDGHLVARHDWSFPLQDSLKQELPEDRQDMPLTLTEFKALKIDQKYTPMSFEDVAELLLAHPDAYVITDTKETTEEEVRAQFEALVEAANRVDPGILDRIIPQIYNEAMLDFVMDAHGFKSVVYTLYMHGAENFSEDPVIEFAGRTGIGVIVTNPERFSDRMVQELSQRGIKVYMHTFNDVQAMNFYREKGVLGFYTDFILPEDMELE